MSRVESEFTMSSAESSRGRALYDAPHLARNPANFAALSPLGFLARAAAVYPDKLAVVHDTTRVPIAGSMNGLANLPTPCAGAG